MSEDRLKKLEIGDVQRLSSNGRGKRVWIIILSVFLALIVLVVVKGLFKRVEVTAAKAYEAALDEPITVLSASGYVTPRRKATVAAKITGRVKEILVEEGMSVKEGDTLALLDEKDAGALLDQAKAGVRVLEAQVAGTEAKLEEARLSLERGKSLHESGFMDSQSLDGLNADFLLLESEVKALKRQIDEAKAGARVADREVVNCEVKAPFDGIVISKDAQPGEMVSPFSAGGSYTRTGIVTIVDMSSLEIEVDVSESHLSKVKPDGKVIAVLDAYPDFKVPCKVGAIIPSADRQKATVKVRISFEKLDPRILPDMGVRVSFLREFSAGKSVFLTKGAVRNLDEKSWVYVLKDETVEKREVALGEEGSDFYEVRQGLKAGEIVIAEPSDEIEDGQKIKIKNKI